MNEHVRLPERLFSSEPSTSGEGRYLRRHGSSPEWLTWRGPFTAESERPAVTRADRKRASGKKNGRKQR